MSFQQARSYDALQAELPRATMTRAHEAALSMRALAGDTDAINELAAGHLRFGMSVARHYHRRHPNVDLSDLVSASFMGLMRAAETFDGSRGNRFISYASHWVHQRCRLELANLSTPVRLPPSISQGVTVVKKYYAQPENAHRRPHLNDTDDILKTVGPGLAACKGKRSFVESAIVSQHYHRSLDAEVGTDGGHTLTHKDRLADHSADPTIAAEAKSTVALLERMIDGLPARHQYIMRRYFLGDNGEDPVSLDAIAGEMGVTRERIRQIKNEAVEEIRKRWGGEISLLMLN